jgi:hypothetical protein
LARNSQPGATFAWNEDSHRHGDGHAEQHGVRAGYVHLRPATRRYCQSTRKMGGCSTTDRGRRFVYGR